MMMAAVTIIATTTADNAIAQFSETPADEPAFSFNFYFFGPS